MIRIFLLIGLLSIQFIPAAQTQGMKSYFGIELLKTITVNITKNSTPSFDLEITSGHTIAPRIELRANAGYCRVGRDEVFQNIDFETSGFYSRLGVFGYLGSRDDVRLGLGCYITPSLRNQRGTYIIYGHYLGDYIGGFKNNNILTIALEPSAEIGFRISERYSIALNFKLSFQVHDDSPEESPTYYVPGLGITNNKTVSADMSLFLRRMF
jgi:hypothetical protein